MVGIEGGLILILASGWVSCFFRGRWQGLAGADVVFEACL